MDGAWSYWGEWGSCDSVTGRKKRRRKCDNPPPSNGGAYCSGPSADEELCAGIRYCQARVHLPKKTILTNQTLWKVCHTLLKGGEHVFIPSHKIISVNGQTKDANKNGLTSS